MWLCRPWLFVLSFRLMLTQYPLNPSQVTHITLQLRLGVLNIQVMPWPQIWREGLAKDTRMSLSLIRSGGDGGGGRSIESFFPSHFIALLNGCAKSSPFWFKLESCDTYRRIQAQQATQKICTTSKHCVIKVPLPNTYSSSSRTGRAMCHGAVLWGIFCLSSQLSANCYLKRPIWINAK